MRVLITGASGLLGGRLATLLSPRFEVTGTSHASPLPAGLPSVALDLSSDASIAHALAEARPDAIVHSAALADADVCERYPERARRLNVLATAELARLCRASGLRLVVLSTDFVFDGRSGNLAETSPAKPILVYGRTKLETEEAALSEAPDSVVLRVALVCGRGSGPRATATESIAWALRAGRSLRLFSDQYRTPVDAASLAAAVARALAGKGSGRYHIGGPERVSRHDLGLRVAQQLGLDASLIEAAVQSETPIGAPRPADVSLDSSRAARELGYMPRPLDEAIRESRREPE